MQFLQCKTYAIRILSAVILLSVFIILIQAVNFFNIELGLCDAVH